MTFIKTGPQFVKTGLQFVGKGGVPCGCGAGLGVRPEDVRAGLQVRCSKCTALVTFEQKDVDAIRAELAKARTTDPKPETDKG